MTSLQEAFMDYATNKTGTKVSREEAKDIAMSDLTEEVNTLLDKLYPRWKEASTVEKSLESIGLAETSTEAREYLSQMTLRSIGNGKNGLSVSVYSENGDTYFRFKR